MLAESTWLIDSYHILVGKWLSYMCLQDGLQQLPWHEWGGPTRPLTKTWKEPILLDLFLSNQSAA